MYEFGMNFIASHPIIKPERKSETESEEPPVVPPIDFFEKQKQKLEEERERLEAEKAQREARQALDGKTDAEETTDEEVIPEEVTTSTSSNTGRASKNKENA